MHRTTFVRGLRCVVAYRVGRILPRETVSVHGGGPSGVRRLWDRVSVGMIGVCGSSTTRVRAVDGESRWACAAGGEARGACWTGRTWSGGHPGRPGCPGRAPRPATPRTILRRTDQLSSAHHAAENPRSQRGDIRGPALRWPMPERTCSSASPVSCSLSVNSHSAADKKEGAQHPISTSAHLAWLNCGEGRGCGILLPDAISSKGGSVGESIIIGGRVHRRSAATQGPCGPSIRTGGCAPRSVSV
jgi:hypothetical protein